MGESNRPGLDVNREPVGLVNAAIHAQMEYAMLPRLTGFSEQIHRIMMNLAYDPVVQDCLAAETSIEKFRTRQLLVRRLSQSTGIMDGIRAIVVRSHSGTPTSDSKLIGPMDIALLPEPARKVTEFMGMFSSNTIGNPSVTTFQYYLVGLKSYSVRPNAKTLTEMGSVFMMLDGARIGRSTGKSRPSMYRKSRKWPL